MNKQIWILVVLGLIIIILLAILVFTSSKPFQSPSPSPTPAHLQSGIVITSPKTSGEISSPDVEITGYVNGDGWIGFEGQVGTVKLQSANGDSLDILGPVPLTAITEWTTLPVYFKATLQINSALASGDAELIFHNENPSGDPVKDKTFVLPVKIKADTVETMTVKVYFGKNEITGSTCSVVFPIDRVVPKTTAVARTALDELLKGPTQAEKDAGYFSSIPSGSKLNSITIVDGEARADFNAITESGGGSCSMTERVSEINFTLKQFPTITSVKLSIDGRTGDIFQP